jgi:hypothetical protein
MAPFVALGFYAGVVAVDIGLVDAMQRANQRSSRLADENHAGDRIDDLPLLQG